MSAQQGESKWIGPMVFLGITLIIILFAGMCSGPRAQSDTQTAETEVKSPEQAKADLDLALAEQGPFGEVQVARVIDGNTFEVVGGGTVRALGIDSCKPDTPGGQDAKRMAERLLSGWVFVGTQIDVNRDETGQLLRWVEVPGGDFDELMVAERHTGVRDADDAINTVKMSRLRAKEYNGRECFPPKPYIAPRSTPTYEPTYESVPDYTPYYDPDPYLAPRYESNDESSSGTKRRTGNTGHPCLPGEIDGDNDGYCKEGR